MSDYLWDKTGEPDAEVERLEKLLGGLGHQPRAPELPRDARLEQAPRRPWSRPALAAAAALALMLLAGAWLFAARMSGDGPPTARDSRATAPRTEERAGGDGKAATPRDVKSEAGAHDVKNEGPAERAVLGRPSRQQTGRGSAAQRQRRGAVLHAHAGSGAERRGGGRARPREDLLASVTERRQSAKEQLVYALRLTGAKLSEVQTKVSGAGEARDASEERKRIR